MNARRRFALLYRLELSGSVSRPLLWVLLIILGLTAWGLSTGQMTIASGSSSVGGTKAWITSEFANAKMLPIVIFIFYAFFIAIACGTTVMRDEEMKVGEILHATPLRPGEYLWGKFAALLSAFLAILGLHLLLAMFFNHLVPNPKAIEIRGPLSVVNYLRPALVLGLPSMIFLAGTAFAIGDRTRRPILIFVLPVATMLVSAFFLWNWTPSWLDPRINRFLMLIDPAGVRWISETWLKVDRGVDFYNHAPVVYDLPFVLSRLGFVAIGILAVVLDARRFERKLRAAEEIKAPRSGALGRFGRRGSRAAGAAGAAGVGGTAGAGGGTDAIAGGTGAAGAGATLGTFAPLSALGMSVATPGLLRGVWSALHFELKELRSQPGLYLFVPIILLQVLGTSLVAVGAFDTPVLVTAGTIAVRTMNIVTVLFCLLALFYAVESLRRERSTGIAAMYYSTPVRTASFLAGKALANGVVGIVVLLGTFVGGAIAILVQHKVALDIRPFLVVWGFGLLPTFLLWTTFVMALYAVTGSRYTTYALALAALALTGWLQTIGKMTWAGNWNLWSVLLWSDLGTLEIARLPLLLNRLAALGLSVFFLALAVAFFPRRERDAVLTVHRAEPGRLVRSAGRMLPYAIVPAGLVIALVVLVNQGFQGKAEEKLEKDYWKQNLATWKDVPLPAILRADVDLNLDPPHRSFRSSGSFLFRNDTGKKLAQIPLSGGTHWEGVAWRMNGAEYKPEDRSRLYVFTPPAPLAPGDTVRIGFAFHGVYPKGITKNGGGTMEYILPSGAVLTSFSPSFVPVLGYLEDVGVNDKNRYEKRVYPDDFYEGITKPFLGTGAPFTTRIRITAPAAYTLNSVGTLTSETVEGGRRTAVWESDQPVRFFNVVAGSWDVQRAGGTAVFYYPKHKANVVEMSEALQAARTYYSEWFYPYPWKELKVSEFSAISFYAQGFPTDITFSEGIGFLTKSDPKTNAAFFVTAHESAHQWWGNILTPGQGPGGEILAEGMSHFSTILLLEQCKGERDRIEFCKRIEERYGDQRQVDAERSLLKIDGSHTGDQTVTYDKGGWVFWMLLNRMGRDSMLTGLREFIRDYKDGPDYPVLQDFLADMRVHASDPAAFDDFADQWFRTVVMPEYRLSKGERVARPAPAGTPDSTSWEARVHVANAGTGRMPLEIAAVSGDRFQKDGKPAPDYRESRVAVTLDKGQETDVTIPCAFRPDRVLVDPDAKVLQLRRKAALVRF